MWLQRSWFTGSLVILFFGVVTSDGPLLGLGAILFLAGLLARTWSQHALDDLRYERRMPESRAFAGERLRLTLRLVNDKLLPLPWVELRDLVPENLPLND